MTGEKPPVGEDHAVNLVGTGAKGSRFTLSEGGRPWSRHPADSARLVFAVVLALAGLALVATYPGDLRSFSTDLVRLANHLPDLVQKGLIGLVQLLAVATPLVLLGLAVWWKRPVQMTVALVAAGAGAVSVALLQSWMDQSTPMAIQRGLDGRGWITGAAFPSASYLAGLAAGITVLSTSFSHRWRRAAWIWMAILSLVRILTAVALPVHLVTTIALGVAVGSALLVVLGSPARWLDVEAVRAALVRTGLNLENLTLRSGPATLTRTMTGQWEQQPVLVQVVGRDERDAELLVRAVNLVRVKGLDDDRPSWSADAVVAHQGLCGLLAQAAGVNTPAVHAVTETEEGDGILVTADPRGSRLVDVDDSVLSDEVLSQAWLQLSRLHARGIAHRRANLGRLTLDHDGEVSLTGFQFANLVASEQLRATDVAELVMSMAARVGVERALQGALTHMPQGELAAALPMIQPLAVSPGTRQAVKASSGKALWDETRAALQARLGVESYELTRLDRISLSRLVGIFGGTVMAYVLLAFASNWAAIGQSLSQADWTYLPPLVALALVGFVGGVWSLQGAVTVRLPFWETLQVMFAQSFLNRFTPANAGGMALRTRYLQRHGVDLTLSAASIGLTSAASGVMQVLLLVTFMAWAGSNQDLAFSLPDMVVIARALVVVLVLAGGLYLMPWGRRLFGQLIGSVREAAGELMVLARDPMKVLQLFGGAAFSKVVTIMAFNTAVHALGVDGIGFATLAVAYMTANTVASVAPTPGGVGAIEAALVAVLTGLGVDPPTALSIVLVFRLVTYWMTVPVCWFFLGLVRRSGIV